MAVAKTKLITIVNNILQKIGEAKITSIANASAGVEYNVVNYVEDILFDIYNRGNWPFLTTMFTNDSSYTLEWTTATRKLTLPDEVNENFLSESGSVLLVTGAASSETDATVATTLSYTEPLQFFKAHPYDITGSPGAPTEFTMVGRDIYVDPTPTANTYSLKIITNINKDKIAKFGDITAAADAGGGQVTITSAGHDLSNNDQITISNTTSYNGTFTVTNVTTDTFEVTDTWVATETGDWRVTGETTYTALPVQWEYVLEAGVMWSMLAERDPNGAAIWKTRYDEAMQIMIQQYGLKMKFDETLK